MEEQKPIKNLSLTAILMGILLLSNGFIAYKAYVFQKELDNIFTASKAAVYDANLANSNAIDAVKAANTAAENANQASLDAQDASDNASEASDYAKNCPGN